MGNEFSLCIDPIGSMYIFLNIISRIIGKQLNQFGKLLTLTTAWFFFNYCGSRWQLVVSIKSISVSMRQNLYIHKFIERSKRGKTRKIIILDSRKHPEIILNVLRHFPEHSGHVQYNFETFVLFGNILSNSRLFKRFSCLCSWFTSVPCK